MKKTKLEAKFTKSSENFSKLKRKTQNFEKNLKNSSKKLKVSANPLGLLAENRSKKAWVKETKMSIMLLSVFFRFFGGLATLFVYHYDLSTNIR